MGNHDLLSDDDFFEKSKPGKKDPKAKKEEVYSEEEDFLKSKPHDQDTLDLEDIESSLQERPEDSEDKSYNLFEEEVEEQDSFEPSKPVSEAAPESPAPKTKKDLNYQKVYFDADSKQQGISYRPFIIGIVVVIILAVGGYFLYNWYFGSKSTIDQTNLSETTEAPAEDGQPGANTPEQIQADQQRNTFLANIAGRTKGELNSVSGVVEASLGDTKLSSVLLYDSDLMFEVFGNSRADLARLNINLKEKFKNQDFKIVSSSQRPGDNGGIFGIYSAKLDNSGGSTNDLGPVFKSSREADQWLQGIFNQSNLKYDGVKNRKSTSVDMFTVYEIECTATGSIDACRNAVNKIASAGSNIRIHKLTFTALDQKDFTEGRYQLKLVLKIYA